MSEMRFLLRAILGGLLAISLGENLIVTGLITSPLFLPLLIWYIFLFLTFDWLIIRFKLSDRVFFVFNAILAILIGGILDREFFTPRPEMGIFGLDPFSTLLNTLWWGASFILLFHLVNTLVSRQEKPLGVYGVWLTLIFVILTLVTMGSSLPLTLATANPLGLTLLLLLVGILTGKLLKMIRSSKPETRPIIQKNFLLVFLPIIFIILVPLLSATLLGPDGYWILSIPVVIIVLLVMSRYKIAI